MQSLLYGVWLLLPITFFLIALWAKLEQLSNKHQRQNPGDFFNQGIFLTGCVIASILIDQLLLSSVIQGVLLEWFPMWFFQLLLLPMVILVGAKVVGPSRSILIARAPHLSDRRPDGKGKR